MIVFDLRCDPAGHVFEAWFASGDEYERQRGVGLVQCPICGCGAIDKAAMAPRIATSEGEEMGALAHDPTAVKRMLAEMAAAQKRLLQSSENVGARFADEARAIHQGDADERPIHGRATRSQAESLIADGVSVAPLPFPVIEQGDEN